VTKLKKTIRKKPKDTTPALLDAIVFGMQEVKAKEINILDLRNLQNAMSDYFVICHGTSNTQVQAIAGSIEKETKKQCADEPWHMEGTKNAKWILMDYVNVVVHIFDEEARNFYGLEDLWADAPVEQIKD
jgi:ribosome-associated protein